jgi:hypothetical protein
MAEYIKFRLTAAKVSVTVAFLGLLSGLAAKTGLARSPAATPAAAAQLPNWAPKLSLSGLPANLQDDLTKLEGTIVNVYKKAEKDLGALTVKLEKDYYTRSQANSTFISIKNTGKFVIKGETVGNSNELGGLPASGFVQGQGQVGTGALQELTGASPRQTLLTVPGTNGEIIVVCQPAPASIGGIEVLIHNGTKQSLPAVQDQPASSRPDSPITLKAGGDTQLTVIDPSVAPQVQLHLQTFPTAGFNQVLTLTISAESAANGVSVVGQVLNGDG